MTPGSVYRLMLLDLRAREARELLRSEASIRAPALSGDAKRLAFSWARTGESQVYVCSFPACDTRVPVSFAGGREPLWSKDGTELFFRRDDQVWVVQVPGDDGLEVPRPRLSRLSSSWRQAQASSDCAAAS